MKFLRKDRTGSRSAQLAALLEDYSIEILPRHVDDFESISRDLPTTSRIYIAHTDGTPYQAVVNAAKRFRAAGYAVMPHVPARSIATLKELKEMLSAYRHDAGIEDLLVLAGGRDTPVGDFSSSIELFETGLFERYQFRRVHVAGHPEGNKACDPAGSHAISDQSLLWKQAFAKKHGMEMAIVTQFAFDPGAVIAWADRLAGIGITLPIHVGVAGPTKITTLIKYSISCGVGPSLSMLQKRATDISKLLLPYEPTDVIEALALHLETNPESLIEQLHFFAFGGVSRTALWANERLLPTNAS